MIRARLSDAKFFYETDLKTKLEARLPKFEQIVFHEKLGTQAKRFARIEMLAAELAPLIGADVDTAKRAAQLAKADLLTEVVGEFPELQGLMGKYYALAQGEDASVAAASEEHYKPLGPGDRVPADPVSVVVALADKLDVLTGFWAIDEKPTGSKDPYALRRAALGIIRLVLDNKLRIRLTAPISLAAIIVIDQLVESEKNAKATQLFNSLTQFGLKDTFDAASVMHKAIELAGHNNFQIAEDINRRVRVLYPDLLSFFADRLKVQLREQGARHDLVDAVFALEGQDDLLLIVRRVEALGKFLDTDDGKNLLAGTKRAANILRIEEKKDNKAFSGAPDPRLYQQDEERALAEAVNKAKADASAAVAKEDFATAMSAMAKLRPHVDAFFDKVTVNVAEGDNAKAVRENRLKLLNEIREATRAVADFSKIEG